MTIKTKKKCIGPRPSDPEWDDGCWHDDDIHPACALIDKAYKDMCLECMYVAVNDKKRKKEELAAANYKIEKAEKDKQWELDNECQCKRRSGITKVKWEDCYDGYDGTYTHTFDKCKDCDKTITGTSRKF